MTIDPIAEFDRLNQAAPGASATVMFDTACVLGGSMAGLFAARVLAGYAKRVVVIELDEAREAGRPRAGVPQDRHVHTLLPAGRYWLERWLPGITREIEAGGGVLAHPDQAETYLEARPQVRTGEHSLLLASRPFLESRVRARVLGLPNVSLLRSRATGLEYRGNEVAGVRCARDGVTEVIQADIVVDAMGRASKLSDWLRADGYDSPPMQRLPSAINYATALFRRRLGPQDLELTCSIARFGPPYPADGVAVAAVNAIEGDRWMVMLAGYDEARPGRNLDDFRAACAKLPPLFPEAASDVLLGEIETYHQAESRRRDYGAVEHYPARLVSVGDAVASFNPIYGQGMSSAALHAACLSEFLGSGPSLHEPATGFFARQDVVVDAAWSVSAGSDAARLDAMSGADVPEEVRHQRRVMDQILRATLVSADVCRAFENVAFMLAHPGTLASPELAELALSANQQVAWPQRANGSDASGACGRPV
jgi:2-polyprenyl-6-methoxyphenol hydroxylase-like FAD-dependent oxidoreductase